MEARALYEELIATLRSNGLIVQTGKFREMMRVELVNDGPVTLFLDSRPAQTS
jgi:D-tyrosyl-tRNA(Tyr) deacylase